MCLESRAKPLHASQDCCLPGDLECVCLLLWGVPSLKMSTIVLCMFDPKHKWLLSAFPLLGGCYKMLKDSRSAEFALFVSGFHRVNATHCSKDLAISCPHAASAHPPPPLPTLQRTLLFSCKHTLSRILFASIPFSPPSSRPASASKLPINILCVLGLLK